MPDKINKQSETTPLHKRNIASQMADAILKDDGDKLPPQKKKELSKRLSGRAMEYFMFMDDNE